MMHLSRGKCMEKTTNSKWQAQEGCIVDDFYQSLWPQSSSFHCHHGECAFILDRHPQYRASTDENTFDHSKPQVYLQS